MKKAIVCILALALVLAASLALADQKITLMLGNSQRILTRGTAR